MRPEDYVTPAMMAARRMFNAALAAGKVITHHVDLNHITKKPEERKKDQLERRAKWARENRVKKGRENVFFEHEPKKPAGTHIPRFGQIRPF